jgi:hypothetical protein
VGHCPSDQSAAPPKPMRGAWQYLPRRALATALHPARRP